MNDKKYRQIIKEQSEILLFGKHKHQTIQHVLRTEPSYILWLHEEGIVKFPKEIVSLAEDAELDNRMDKAMSNFDWGLDYGRDE